MTAQLTPDTYQVAALLLQWVAVVAGIVLVTAGTVWWLRSDPFDWFSDPWRDVQELERKETHL